MVNKGKVVNAGMALEVCGNIHGSENSNGVPLLYPGRHCPTCDELLGQSAGS